MRFIPREQQVERPVSHDPSLSKRVIVPGGVIPSLSNFAIATFTPNTPISGHRHTDLSEVFYIAEGAAVFVVDGRRIVAAVGDCLVVEPGEKHSLVSGADGDLVLLYFAIATSPSAK